MTRRGRRRLLAIPPESKSERMSALVHTGRSIYFEGNDDKQPDWFCGRCGRILAVRIAPGQIRNLWLACPKCSWLNGFDIDLGWAKYVVEELEARRLSLERLEQLLDDLKDESVTTEEFLDRNPDVAGPIAWLARISLPTLVAILTLIYMVYSGERSAPRRRADEAGEGAAARGAQRSGGYDAAGRGAHRQAAARASGGGPGQAPAEAAAWAVKALSGEGALAAPRTRVAARRSRIVLRNAARRDVWRVPPRI